MSTRPIVALLAIPPFVCIAGTSFVDAQVPQQTCTGGTISYEMTPDTHSGTGATLQEARENALATWPGVPACPECPSPAHNCLQTRSTSGAPLSEIQSGPVGGIYTKQLTYRPTVTLDQTCDC